MKLDDVQSGLILEDEIAYADWVPLIQQQPAILRIYATRCSAALTLIEPLYHGKAVSGKQIFIQKPIRTNRHNLTTPQWFSSLFNRIVEKKFGAAGLLRSASVFLTTDEDLAYIFGDICFALPFNETKFLVYKGALDTSVLAFQIASDISRLMYGAKDSIESLSNINTEGNLSAVMKIINNEDFFNSVYKTYEKNFFFFNDMAALAAFVELNPICEIMAGGVNYIPLVKAPTGIDRVKAWNLLRADIQKSV